ncbi:GTP binding protein [Dipsacomyces acuminosporus]|nr:GTP binding protein [Dipsacomyces acuminosporus]
MYSEDVARHRYPSVLDEGVSKLPPELDKHGNIEYKTKLDTMLAEGNGHAIYVVGVHDNGDVVGITQDEFDVTMAIMKKMAAQLDNVRIASVNKRVLLDMDGRVVAEVHLTRRNCIQRTEMRVTVLGNHGSGKSTMLACLTHGESDNGRGKSRINLLRHRHEVESGRTSSITFAAIGFDADGQLLNYSNNRSADLVFQRSRHVVTFIDTCGHSKHLKTTASAMAGYSSQAFCIVIAADAEEISAATIEYLTMAAVLEMPLMVVVTKMDVAVKNRFAALVNELLCVLDAAVPGRAKCLVTDSSSSESLAYDMLSLDVIPIFTTSAVKLVGFDELISVLSHAKPPLSASLNSISSAFEFHVENLYSIDIVGTVVTGWVESGTLHVGQGSSRQLAIGPDSSGRFTDICVTSIHALRMPTETADAKSSAALAIQPSKPVAIRKGMVVLDAAQLSANCRRISKEFTARVMLLNTRISNLSTVIVHVRSAYHQAQVVRLLDHPAVANADAGYQKPGAAFVTVWLRFIGSACDYIYAGIPIIARDGPNLAFAGHITNIL